MTSKPCGTSTLSSTMGISFSPGVLTVNVSVEPAEACSGETVVCAQATLAVVSVMAVPRSNVVTILLSIKRPPLSYAFCTVYDYLRKRYVVSYPPFGVDLPIF